VQVSHSKTPTAVTGVVCVFGRLACLHSAEACVVARAGRTAIYEAIRSGELVARKRGRKTIILAEVRPGLNRTPVVRVPDDENSTAARHAEIARRYAWQAKENRRKKGPRLLTLARLRELERLYEDR